VIEGEGAFTTVDGDKCVMGRGDLVLTPPWTWHDHGNDSTMPMLWLDGLDLPMVAEMEGQFYEPFAEEAQPIGKPVGDSERRYGIGQLRPTWEKRTGAFSPLLNYKWDRTEEALRRLAAVSSAGASPFDDVAMEYINPHTGGPLMPTIACWIQLLRPGVRTKAHRSTGSAVYLAFEGRGSTVIDGERFDWRKGDLFVVPTWAWHEHASADGEAILFSVQDTPVMQALGLFREQAYRERDGHQAVTRVFEG
jgi:gentisate 1,2-dioxygenase